MTNWSCFEVLTGCLGLALGIVLIAGFGLWLLAKVFDSMD